MQNVHPTATAALGTPQKVVVPIHPTETKENIINCPHCGLPNDTRLDTGRPAPDGSNKESVLVSIAVPSGSKDVYEPAGSGGCRFCHMDYRTSSYRRPFYSRTNLQRG